jgi:hypothetical protein
VKRHWGLARFFSGPSFFLGSGFSLSLFSLAKLHDLGGS